jgi:glutaredoxin 3
MDANGKSPEILVYTTEPCRRCLRAKELIASRGLAYTEVNLAKDPVGRRALVKQTGQVTFPQIVIDGRPLGGFEQLVEADERGELEALATPY